MTAIIRIAAALIDDGAGRILLVRKRGAAMFMQAGGKIDPGETPQDALARELAEELNFAPLPHPPVFLGSFADDAANEPGHRVEAQLFHLSSPGRSFLPAAELEEVRWVAIDEAAQLPLAPLTRNAVLPLARRRLRSAPDEHGLAVASASGDYGLPDSLPSP